MKVEHTPPSFQSLAIGEVFRVNAGDAAFVKIDQLFKTSTDCKNCICLNDGKPHWFSIDTVVVPCPNATVIL